MKFNLNDYIKVQLTSDGREIHRAQHAKTFKANYDAKLYPYRAPEEDEAGWSRWQMWDFMVRFGSHISMAGDLPVMTDIEIEAPDGGT